MKTIVAKFGGTSLADAQQIRKTREIILSDPDRKYIVVSAPGKRFPQDSKITDLLLSCYEAAAKNENYEQDLQIVQERFRETAEGLDLDFRIDEEISPLRVYLAETAGAGEDKKKRSLLAENQEVLYHQPWRIPECPAYGGLSGLYFCGPGMVRLL